MSELPVRDSALLVRLGAYRFLSRDQIEAFVFDGADVTAASRQVMTQRILRRLVSRGLVVAYPRGAAAVGAGGPRTAYALSRAGQATARRIDPRLPRWRWSRGTVSIRHSLVTAEVALAFRAAARATPGHQIIEWELERNAAARLGSSDVVPDAFLVYATPDCELHACIEVDLDTESPRRFAQKIREYLDCYRGGSWRAWVRAWPVVLTIAPTEARAKALQRTAELVLREPQAEPLRPVTEFDFASLDSVRGALGPLGAIWRVAGQPELRPLVPLARGGSAGVTPGGLPAPTRTASGQRCVYVVELKDVEPTRTTRLPCVYVGQSAQPAEVRLAQHRAGYKSSRFVRRYGLRLRPDLSAQVPCTPDWQTALRREADLAADLRRAGYCVHGGH